MVKKETKRKTITPKTKSKKAEEDAEKRLEEEFSHLMLLEI